jgi:hypothetical protein
MRLLKTVCVFLALTSRLICAQVPERHNDTSDVRRFVQAFYDWYAPLAQRSDSTVASEIARKEKASMFDTYLLGELTMDAEAEAKAAVGQTVGIDFDSCLSGQDPCEHYETGKAIRRIGDSWSTFSACAPVTGSRTRLL